MSLSDDDQPTIMQDGPTIMETDGGGSGKPPKDKKAEGNSDRAGKISLSQRNHQRSVCADCCYGADVRVGLWQDNSASGDTASATTAAKDQDESSSDSTTAGTTTEKAATTTTEASSDEDLPDIEAQDTVDYTNVLYLKGYETFSADGYSFGYPKAFIKLYLRPAKVIGLKVMINTNGWNTQKRKCQDPSQQRLRSVRSAEI